MLPNERRETGQSDLFRARLDQIVDLNHALAKLARAIDWSFLEQAFGGPIRMLPDARRCRRG
jgi:IS5 family transposase